MPFKLLLIMLCISLGSCVSLESYERVYVNDPEMQLSNDSGQNFQTYVNAIREGATPAMSLKSSGGCGCN